MRGDTMQVSITGKKIDIGDALRSHTEMKVRDLIQKYDIEPIEANIVIEKDGHHKDGTYLNCGIDLHLGRGVFVRSHANSDDAYVCVDSAIETLETRIRKHKGKISTLNRKRDNDIEVGAPAL